MGVEGKLEELRDKYKSESEKRGKIKKGSSALHDLLSDKINEIAEKPEYKELVSPEDIAFQKRLAVLQKMSVIDGLSEDDILTKTFENFRINHSNSMMYNSLDSWTPEKPCGILIYGPPGTGKTHLLKALAVRWSGKDRQVTFSALARILDIFRANFDDIESIASRYKTTPILFIDDFGAEKTTEFSEDKLCQILDFRIQRNLLTFATSNIEPPEIARRYHPRILDRLKELMVLKKLDGPSHRDLIQEGLKNAF